MCLFHGIPTYYAPSFCNMSFEHDILLISCNLVLFCRGLPWKIHSQKQPIAVIAERRLQYGNYTVKVPYKLAAKNVVEINAKVLHRKQTCPLKIYGWKMYWNGPVSGGHVNFRGGYSKPIHHEEVWRSPSLTKLPSFDLQTSVKIRWRLRWCCPIGLRFSFLQCWSGPSVFSSLKFPMVFFFKGS